MSGRRSPWLASWSDGTIEARLWQLVLEQELGCSDWNGWCTAVARGRA